MMRAYPGVSLCCDAPARWHPRWGCGEQFTDSIAHQEQRGKVSFRGELWAFLHSQETAWEERHGWINEGRNHVAVDVYA